MNLGQIKIPLAMWQLEEILEKRIEQQKHKIDDLFFVFPSADAVPNPGYYDGVVETKYGKLRFFLTEDCPHGKAYVFHKAKFSYPKKNNFDHFDKDGNLVNADKTPLVQ